MLSEAQDGDERLSLDVLACIARDMPALRWLSLDNSCLDGRLLALFLATATQVRAGRQGAGRGTAGDG